MPRMTKDQVRAAAQSLLNDSEGYDTDELSGLHTEALDYYYNRPKAAPSAPGRSALQSSDVADMIEAVTAQIMPAFDTDQVVEFEPLHPEDVEQARTETHACTYVIMRQNNGYIEITEAVKDALLLRNGILKVFLEENEEVTAETYTNLTALEYGDLRRQSVADLSQVDNGMMVEDIDDPELLPGFHTVRVTTKETQRKVCVKSVDPINFSWERDHNSIYLDNCRFVAERYNHTRSELIEMGYPKKKINSLNAGATNGQIDNVARNQNAASKAWRGFEPSQDLLEYYEMYIRMDIDGDGIAELSKVCMAGNEILKIEDAEYIPYASGTPFVQPHRFNGLGMFDKLRYVQDAKTATLRQLVDNQNHANNARIGVVDGQVNIDDVTNSRPGGVVRMRSPDSIVPFPFTDIGGSAQSTLDYLDKVRSERGGASLDMMNAQMQIAGDTAHGVERQMSAKEQMAAMITRSIAETLIKTTYQLVHKALRLYVPDDFEFMASDQFVTSNPAQWQERERVNVKAGLSPAERARKSATLEGIVAQQLQLAQMGDEGVLYDKANLYNALLDWSRCSGITSPERYFIDPDSEQAQAAAQQKAEAAQAQQQQEQEYQQMLVEMQKEVETRAADNADAKVFEDGRQFDAELAFKYYQEDQKADIAEAELTVETALKMVGSDEQTATGADDSQRRAAGGTS